MTTTRVLGVAGHIDHGKTSLVRALTGVDTDRLPEEKARGITIELGFAHTVLPNGTRLAVVDMPGHERFVRAMIAGAGGVDALLLVVAANEGVMPQTREHLAVASLLGVRAGVVALSKGDTASDEVRALCEEEVREVLAGSALAGAEVVTVSAHTGEGLDALRAALARAVAAPPREDPSGGPLVLPIDRVFVRKGFGAVVTGTLVSGSVREGDAVAVGPLGAQNALRTARVRGLQVHGEAVSEAHASTRLAVNLAGVEAGELERGAWLVREGELAVTRAFDAEVRCLPSALRALPRRARLELAVGAAHAEATVALHEGDALAPGASALARVTLERPVVLRSGERFVLRGPPSMAGYGSTVGGGVVLRPVAARERARATGLQRAEAARQHADDAAARARLEAEAAGARGLSARALAQRAGFFARPDERAAWEAAGLVLVSAERVLARAALERVGQRVLAVLSAFHAAQPAERGAELGALRAELGAGVDEELAGAALERLVREKKVSREGERYARAGYKPRDPDALPHLRAVREALVAGGVTPPRVEDIAKAQGVDAKALEPALKRLVDQGLAVRVSVELYADAAAMSALEARLRAWLEARGSIDAQGFKELTGATRKWSIPLSEYFDAKKVTLRVGDVRKLRR